MIEFLGSDQPIKKDDGTWYNNIIDDEGTLIRQITGGYNDVMSQMKGIKSKSKNDIKKKEKDLLHTNINQLENIINGDSEIDSYVIKRDGYTPPISIDKIDHVDAEMEQKRAEYKEQFDAAEATSKLEAQNLLISIVTLYFSKGLIDDNQYLKYKMDIEQKSLQALISQLDQAKKVIYKISESIHLGLIPLGSVPRTVEVLTGLQRVVLDISKYQHEFIRDVEKQIREFKNEMVEENKVADSGTIAEAEFAESTVISVSDRKKLLDDMKEFIRDNKQDLLVQKSKNGKLNLAENIEFSEENDGKRYMDVESGDAADGNAKNGLDTFQ